MRLPSHFDGPAPQWPRPLDAALERWAAMPPRVRVAARAAAAVVVVLAATGGLLEGPWGPPVHVLVARHDLPAGTGVGPDDVVLARRPARLVPSDALTAATQLPEGGLSDGHLPAGTVVTARAVQGGGPGAAAFPGTAVVAVPAEDLPPLPLGTRMDLAVATFDGAAKVVARDAVLVADDGTWRWVRVERGAVGDLARGITDATLVAAVLPPRGDAP